MELVIRNIKSKSDLKLFRELAKRLGLKTTDLTEDKKKDIALGKAIKEAEKGDFVNREEVIKALRKVN
jgi:hypothetical protein